MTAWILVSDASRSKLLTTELPEHPWTLVEAFEHPEGREASREIRPSSPPGRMLQSMAKGGRRSAMEPRTTPKEAEVERFAHELCQYLENAASRRQFDVLVLVAPPHFLGILQGALGRQSGKCLRASVNKDLSMFDAAELRKRLGDVVFGAASDSGAH
jgi:protein required for attachment to host cells